MSAVLELAKTVERDRFEFQRLHGMGESLHDQVLKDSGVPCRIYAPVGAHRDLLAYLVRRLLENGANSSFVNQIVDTRITPEEIAKDPIDKVEALGPNISSKAIVPPPDLFGKARRNSKGWDITDPLTLEEIEKGRGPFRQHRWEGGPLVAGDVTGGDVVKVSNPANPDDQVGQITFAADADIQVAIGAAEEGYKSWSSNVGGRACRLCAQGG